MTETPYEKAVRQHKKRPPPATPPMRHCKRCPQLIRRQHGRQFCGGCTKHTHSRRRWARGSRSEWL